MNTLREIPRRRSGFSALKDAYTSMQKSAQTAPIEPDSIEEIDSLCMRALCQGDHSAFANIVERWQNRLINFFYRTTRNRSDAEDLAQETFVELYRSTAHYKERGSFKAFLFTIARRKMIDSYRKRTRRPLDYLDPSSFTLEQAHNQSDHSSEIEEAFQIALARLPEKHRSAILMRQQQELSYEEIADCMQASLSTVKSWIHRARTQLREYLKDFH